MIGIISDTHDNVDYIKKAVRIFKKSKCDLVVHCGDIIASYTVQFFSGLRMIFVKGNCDGDVEMLKQKVNLIKGQFFEEIAEFRYKGRKFGVYHGHNLAKLESLTTSGKYDYLLTGHTHKFQDKKTQKTRVINPGALYPTIFPKTAALLDNDVLKFIDLK